MKKKRLLTIGSIVTERNDQYVHVPYIRLGGKWLEDAGFTVGDMITIEPKDGGLMIRKQDGLEQGTNPSKKRIGPARKMVMTEIMNRIALELPVPAQARRATGGVKGHT